MRFALCGELRWGLEIPVAARVEMWIGSPPVYRDREEAGQKLAEVLRKELAGEALPGGGFGDLVVLGAPRGGVMVAVPVAEAFDAPLDVVLARKLPAPGNPELGFGALGEGEVRVIDDEIVGLLGLDADEIEAAVAQVQAEIAERSSRYRRARAAIPLTGRAALIIDDGVATGVTMAAAVGAARHRGAAKVIAAAPVSSAEAKEKLEETADRFISPLVDPGFIGVGGYYAEFPQVTDDEVVAALERFGG